MARRARGRSFGGVLLLISLVTVVICSGQPGGGDVRQVHAIFRHGARTPTRSYPLDPYVNHTYQPWGFAQLTLLGKQQQLALGRFLRARYSDLLGPAYLPGLVEATSTDFDRTLMSGQLVLAGLFPPGPDQLVEEGLAWQPIPVHTEATHNDKLLLGTGKCPRYEAEKRRLDKLPPTSQLLRENEELLEHLRNATGLKMETLFDVFILNSLLHAQETLGLKLPPWTRGVFPEALATLSSYHLALNTQNDVMKRIKAGPLLNKMMDHMAARSRGEAARKMYLYSGHDYTIGYVLSALGHFKPPYVPEYSTLILLELLEPDPGSFFVRILLRAAPDSDDVEELKLEGCAGKCALDDFIRVMEPLRSTDRERECQITD